MSKWKTEHHFVFLAAAVPRQSHQRKQNHWRKRGRFTSSSSRSPYAHLSKLTLMPIVKMRQIDSRGRFGEKVSLCASRRSGLLQPL